jgi:CheY-like chemotaxis protein
MLNTSPTVLVVEDNAETQLLLRHILTANYEPTVVASIDEAVRACEEQSFQLLVMDINLGGKRTGTDLLHALRKPPHSVEAPAIALTAYAMPGDRQRFERAGFDAYVSKPFSQDDLLGTVEACLATSA